MGLLDFLGFGTISDEKRAKIYAQIEQEKRWEIEKIEKFLKKNIKKKNKLVGWTPEQVIEYYVNDHPVLIIPLCFWPDDERKMQEHAKKWAWWFIQKYPEFFPLDYDPFGFLSKEKPQKKKSNADKLEELRLKKEILEMELKLKNSK